MGITAAVVSIGSSLLGAKAQRKARKADKRRLQAQRRLEKIANARAKRKSAAEARRATAQVKAQAAASGAGGSSAVSGAISSISSQAAEQIGFSSVQEATGTQVAGFAQDASNARGRASTFQAISQLPGQLGIPPDLSSVFSNDPPVEGG